MRALTERSAGANGSETVMSLRPEAGIAVTGLAWGFRHPGESSKKVPRLHHSPEGRFAGRPENAFHSVDAVGSRDLIFPFSSVRILLQVRFRSVGLWLARIMMPAFSASAFMRLAALS